MSSLLITCSHAFTLQHHFLFMMGNLTDFYNIFLHPGNFFPSRLLLEVDASTINKQHEKFGFNSFSLARHETREKNLFEWVLKAEVDDCCE